MRRILGRSPKLLELLETVEQVAPTDAPILITGETGTGKELVAREIHARSRRRQGPFVAVNCGAIPANLEEAELFGHTAGAFTGALARKRGRFEAAHGGTLFLDEVGETSAALQVKLLRGLASGEYSPVGSVETLTSDVRVVAATNQEIERRIKEGSFRAELYYRLNVIRLELPALRERRGDILPLARAFAVSFAQRYGRPEPRFEPELEERLLAYDYGGNVRELENLVHRAVVLSKNGTLTCRQLPLAPARVEAASEAAEGSSFHQGKQLAVERFEREYLVSMLKECGGIVSRAAARSGLSERNFHEKLNRYGIDGQSFRSRERP